MRWTPWWRRLHAAAAVVAAEHHPLHLKVVEGILQDAHDVVVGGNRSWALQKCQHDPDYFEKWVDGQRPHSLWIGCSNMSIKTRTATSKNSVYRNPSRLRKILE
jgi:hypothetical protein